MKSNLFRRLAAVGCVASAGLFAVPAFANCADMNGTGGSGQTTTSTTTSTGAMVNDSTTKPEANDMATDHTSDSALPATGGSGDADTADTGTAKKTTTKTKKTKTTKKTTTTGDADSTSDTMK